MATRRDSNPSNLELMLDSWEVIWFKKKVNWSGIGAVLVCAIGSTMDVATDDGSGTWSIASSNEFKGGPTEMSVSGSVRA